MQQGDLQRFISHVRRGRWEFANLQENETVEFLMKNVLNKQAVKSTLDADGVRSWWYPGVLRNKAVNVLLHDDGSPATLIDF